MKITRTLFSLFAFAGLLSLGGCKIEDTEKLTYGQACSTAPDAPKNSDVFTVTPDSLKSQLFSKNMSVLLGLNQVHQSKDQMNIARAQLFPSLNLGALLYSSAGSNFTTNFVEILFPFLVPGNWTRLEESKELYLAQQEAMKTIELNSLASTLSMYVSYLSDQQLFQIYTDESKDLGKIAGLVDHLYQAGLASKSDLDRAQGIWETSHVGLSKVKDLLSQEMASFRHALALDLKTQIDFQDFEVPPSEYESKTIAEIKDQALAVAPEMLQLLHLKAAAEKNVWSQRFAFIGGASVRAPGADTQNPSVAFDNSSVGVNFNIGYAQVPMIELSQDRQKEIELRTEELKLEVAEQSEFAYKLVAEAASRFQMAVKAKNLMQSAYDRDVVRYQYGLADLQTLLNTRGQLRDAVIESLRARIQLGLNRIVLHRLLNTNQFNIKTCK